MTQLIAGSSELAIGCESPSSLDVIAAYGRLLLGVNHANEPSSNRHHASYRMDGYFIVHEST